MAQLTETAKEARNLLADAVERDDKQRRQTMTDEQQRQFNDFEREIGLLAMNFTDFVDAVDPKYLNADLNALWQALTNAEALAGKLYKLTD